MLTDFVVYSRFIFFAKILLGFSSVLIFIGIFFFSSSKKMQNSVTVISKDVKIGVKYQGYNARIKGFTTDGSSFDFHAKSLDPSKKDINEVIITEPKGQVLFSNKEKVNFSAKFAIFNIINKNISFKGTVMLTDSQGNLINTEELTADFEKKRLISPGSVNTKTNMGSINSGGLKYFYGSEIEDGNSDMILDKGINMEFFLDEKK
tara:strand:+ start:71 stop:685 length:615 start_codon:yes stop_codon:yes gene_type:complete